MISLQTTQNCKYLFNINPMFVSLTTHNWGRISYITYIYDHEFLLYYQTQFSSFYCSKRKKCNKQISTSTKRKLPWFFFSIGQHFNLEIWFWMHFKCMSYGMNWLQMAFIMQLWWNYLNWNLSLFVTTVASTAMYMHNFIL